MGPSGIMEYIHVFTGAEEPVDGRNGPPFSGPQLFKVQPYPQFKKHLSFREVNPDNGKLVFAYYFGKDDVFEWSAAEFARLISAGRVSAKVAVRTAGTVDGWDYRWMQLKELPP